MYRAEKVQTENGPTWMIERDSLTNNAPTSARQQGVGGVPALQQEALQELARAIVREAGIARDPEEAGRLENDKARAELFRTMAFLNTALLVGMGATVAFLPELRSIWWLGLSLASNVTGISAALLGVLLATVVVGGDAYRPARTASLRSWRDRVVVAAMLFFAIALVAFDVFAATNLTALYR